MLVVRIELWPGGDESRKRILGLAHIINDGTGDENTGNYVVRLFRWGSDGRIWKSAQLFGFKRKRLGPWDLLLSALNATIGNRR